MGVHWKKSIQMKVWFIGIYCRKTKFIHELWNQPKNFGSIKKNYSMILSEVLNTEWLRDKVILKIDLLLGENYSFKWFFLRLFWISFWKSQHIFK